MTTAVVTGAAGFIGSHLALALAAAGTHVRAVDGFTPDDLGRKRRAAARLATEAAVTVEHLDLATDPLDDLMIGADVAYHLAARPGVRSSWGTGFADYARDNVIATQRLLEAAGGAGVARVVYASSSSVYGTAAHHPTAEDALPAPVSPDGVTKLTGEHICGAYAARGGPSVVSLRYFTVYGPGQRPDMALHRLFRAALGGPPFPRYGDGRQVRDLTYVDDVVRATTAAGAVEVEGALLVNIAGGTRISLGEIIEQVGELVGHPVPVEARPAAPGDVAGTAGAVGRATVRLGWRPQVGLDDGLRRQLDWHRSAGDG